MPFLPEEFHVTCYMLGSSMPFLKFASFCQHSNIYFDLYEKQVSGDHNKLIAPALSIVARDVISHTA